MAYTPFGVSSQTKRNLKAFQFVEKPAISHAHGPVAEAQKENFSIENDVENIENVETIIKRSTTEEATSKTIPPATPVPAPTTRIPLADLIANTEDVFNRQPAKDTTPDDRILWQHGPTSSQPTSFGTPAPRGKKRARSSSPASQNDTSSHFPANESFDLQPLSKHLKTPQNDPADELWARYAEGNIKGGGNPHPAFAHLISSPQTPGKRRDATGLQRSASLGMEWPLSKASKAKRRRIETGDSMDKVKDKFAKARSDLMEPSKSKDSRVKMLVDKIAEGLNRGPKSDPDAPSSSSPLPERNSNEERSLESPTRNKGVDNVGQEEDPSVDVPDQDSEKTIESETIRADEGSSDYGDADFDMDLLEAVERGEAIEDGVGAEAATNENSVQNYPGIQVTGGSLGTEPTHQALITNANASLGKGVSNGSFDEFDDDDDEFVADLEELAAKFDSQRQQPEMECEQDHVQRHGGFYEQPCQAQFRPDRGVAGNGLSAADTEPRFDSDDEFGDDEVDFESLVALENAAMSGGKLAGSPNQSHSSKDTRAIKRYLITNIADGQFNNAKARLRPEKVLLVQDEKTKMSKAIMLRESWYESPCTTGSYIHLIGDFDAAGHCVVDDDHHMLILHPDHLLSATTVADSFTCTRRAVLQDRVKATSEATTPMLYGSILHEVFQEAMKVNQWDLKWLKTTIEAVILRYLDSLFELKLGVPEAVDYLMSKMPELKAWAEVFVTANPKPDAVVKDRNGLQAKMSINKLLDVEEHVWSPMYGLKGNIDATVQVVMQDGPEKKTLTVPLEIKTGKNATDSHRAQTALYTLLLSDRYDVEVVYGILYYMETSDTYRLRGIRHEIRHMIMQRNELACYVRNRLELPPMIKKPHLCGRCYAKTSCFVYHKLGENGDGETSGMAEKFDEVVSHLTPSHQEFFRKWDGLLTKEEKDMFRFRRELWTMLSTEREALGRCFANLVIELGSAYESDEGPKINRYRYTFNKQKDSPGFSFGESQIAVGEPIVISDEKGHFALANGYVTHVRRKRITVAVDRKLHNARVQRPDFDAEMNQSFTGIMEIVDEGDRISTLTPQEPTEQKLYRLDKDEFSNGMATARNNIIRLMEKDLYRARELRDLIIDGKAPEFRKFAAKYTLSGPASQANINIDQHRAIEKVMNAKDYALVLGMPGTGKTTTIAHIIRALVSQGRSVLLTSYTHTAVDNILLKIRDDKIRILRLGAIAKIHPDVKGFADLASVPKNSLEELQVSYEQSSVVATTCLGVNHALFNQRLFDYCIVDEASQITLPVCAGPIRMAKTFILVGDHYQLPPLVQNREAAEGGLDVSLFKLLSDSQPSSVVYLEHQYRMSADIMLLSNTLIYSGRLKCGNEAVATRTLTIPNLPALQSHHYSPTTLLSVSSPKKTQSNFCSGPSSSQCWLSRLISPQQKVVFANTDALLPASLDKVNGARIVNEIEAILVSQFVESLITCGVPARDIGVITFYRSQLSLLKQHLRHRLPELEMHTADKFQGRDKEVVVLSCVRSNEARNVGDLLRDWRRVNVAFTRARSKLVVFGSKGTLGGSNVPVFEGFIDIVNKKGWVVDLPKDATDGHVFEDVISQTSGKVSGRWGESPEKRKAGVKWDSPEKKKSPRKGASPLKARALGESLGKENVGRVGKTKKPEKMGKGMDIERLLGAGKRPVLQDLLNDVMG